MILIIVTLLNLLGGLLIVKGRPYIGHWCFVVADPFFAVHTFMQGEYELCAMFVTYTLMASYGVVFYHEKAIVKKRCLDNE